MSTNIIPFSYADHPVRVIQINGEPWFVPSDVCAILGHRNASQAVAQHVHADDSMRATLTIREGSRDVTRERTLVNESGLYALIFGSSLPQAVKFRRTQQTTKAISLASTIRGDERERADEGGASRVRGISHQANREGDRSRPGAIQRGHGGCPRNQEVRNPGSHGRRSAPRADRRSCRGVSRSVVPVAGRVTNLCQAVGLTPSPHLSRLSLNNGGQKNTGTLNRQIVRPGATTTGVFREYSAAPSITTRSAA